MSNPTTQSAAGQRLAQLASNPSEQQELQSDAELLELYVNTGQPEALAAIVRRHGPMVASVCRLTVADHSSAEDAFQATFLVLMKSASRIRKHSSLGAWLHGVAYRTARRLRKQTRGPVECGDAHLENEAYQNQPDPVAQVARKMELEALDRELENLPERLRVPLVEHYMFGRSAPQIAERLELTTSAVEGRLKRGRHRLRLLLARRGISLAVLVAGSTLFRQHLQAAESSEWTRHFLDQHVASARSPSTQESTGDLTQSNSVSSPASPQVCQLVRKELFMFCKPVPTLQSAIAASILLLCGTLGVLASFPQPAGALGDGGAEAGLATGKPTGELMLEPLPITQRGTPGFTPHTRESRPALADSHAAANRAESVAGDSTLAQFGSGEAGGLGAGGGGGMGQTAFAGQAALGHAAAQAAPPVVPWQRPEGENAGEPAWLAGGRASTDAIERNREALALQIEFNLVELPLREVVAWLDDQIVVQVELNQAALDEIGIDADTPITVRGSGSVREMIRRAVEPLDLTYRVTESTIEITSTERAADSQNMRFYDLSYILPNSAYADEIRLAIENSIQPEGWVVSGGMSSISMVGSTMIVNAPDTTHQSIEILLLNLSQMNPRNTEQLVHPGMGSGGGSLGGGFGGGQGGLF